MRCLFTVLIAVNVVAGCGDMECRGESFFTAGLLVCSEGDVDPSAIGEVVQIVEEEVQVYYPEVVDLVSKFEKNNVKLQYIENPLAMDCKKVPGLKDLNECKEVVGGVTDQDSGNMYITLRDSCAGSIVLVHEMLHTVEKLYFGSAPMSHDRPYFFTQSAPEGADLDSFIEHRGEKRYRDVCPL